MAWKNHYEWGWQNGLVVGLLIGALAGIAAISFLGHIGAICHL